MRPGPRGQGVPAPWGALWLLCSPWKGTRPELPATGPKLGAWAGPAQVEVTVAPQSCWDTRLCPWPLRESFPGRAQEAGRPTPSQGRWEPKLQPSALCRTRSQQGEPHQVPAHSSDPVWLRVHPSRGFPVPAPGPSCRLPRPQPGTRDTVWGHSRLSLLTRGVGCSWRPHKRRPREEPRPCPGGQRQRPQCHGHKLRDTGAPGGRSALPRCLQCCRHLDFGHRVVIYGGRPRTQGPWAPECFLNVSTERSRSGSMWPPPGGSREGLAPRGEQGTQGCRFPPQPWSGGAPGHVLTKPDGRLRAGHGE